MLYITKPENPTMAVVAHHDFKFFFFELSVQPSWLWLILYFFKQHIAIGKEKMWQYIATLQKIQQWVISILKKMGCWHQQSKECGSASGWQSIAILPCCCIVMAVKFHNKTKIKHKQSQKTINLKLIPELLGRTLPLWWPLLALTFLEKGPAASSISLPLS